MTYADASRLFRQGRFRELIDNFKQSSNPARTDRQLLLFVAYVLASRTTLLLPKSCLTSIWSGSRLIFERSLN